MSKVTKALKKAEQKRLSQNADECLQDALLLTDEDSCESFSKEDLMHSLRKISQKYIDLKESFESKEKIYQSISSDKDAIIKNLKFFQNKRKEDILSLKEDVNLLSQKLQEKEAQLINQANLVKRLNHITSKFLELERNINTQPSIS